MDYQAFEAAFEYYYHYGLVFPERKEARRKQETQQYCWPSIIPRPPPSIVPRHPPANKSFITFQNDRNRLHPEAIWVLKVKTHLNSLHRTHLTLVGSRGFCLEFQRLRSLQVLCVSIQGFQSFLEVCRGFFYRFLQGSRGVQRVLEGSRGFFYRFLQSSRGVQRFLLEVSFIGFLRFILQVYGFNPHPEAYSSPSDRFPKHSLYSEDSIIMESFTRSATNPAGRRDLCCG